MRLMWERKDVTFEVFSQVLRIIGCAGCGCCHESVFRRNQDEPLTIGGDSHRLARCKSLKAKEESICARLRIVLKRGVQ
jgi:hypothetical protein